MKKKQNTLKSGRSGKKVTSRAQAIAIGLSEAREKGTKVPYKKAASKKTARKKTAKKTAAKKTASKKTSSKTAAKKTTSKKKTCIRIAFTRYNCLSN